MAKHPDVDGQIVQWDSHFTPAGRKTVESNLDQVGRSMPQRVDSQIEAAKRSSAKKADRTRQSLEAIQPHVKPVPISVTRAAGRRNRLYDDALQRQAGNNGDNVIPPGADWYFEHHARLSIAAEQQGHDPERARYGSALMSPQNSPENERAAMRAIGDALANHKVEVTPEVHQHLASSGIDVSPHVGHTVKVSDLPSGSLGALSTGGFRAQVNTGADLYNVARGGTKENITKAERVLRGEVDPRAAFVNATGAVSAAKIASYAHVTNEAVPGSPTHVEFMGRVHQDALVRAGRIAPDQQALDLYGFQDQDLPPDHLLHPKSHSVEDTWMNSVTFNQPKKTVSVGPNPTSVFKQGGSGDQYPPTGIRVARDSDGKKVGTAHPDARVTDGMTLHAFNNKATQVAAQQHSVPPVAMQAVGWTEARKQAGKSRDGAQAEAGDRDLTPAQAQENVDVFHRMGRTVPRRTPLPEKPRDDSRGQGRLF